MNWKLKFTMSACALALSAQALAHITFYEGEGFRGRAFTTNERVKNFNRYGFNDRASSAIVEGGRWEVCEDARFRGRCTVLREGSYSSLRGMGVNNRISSVRPTESHRHYANNAPEPLAQPDYDYRRRAYEPVYEAQVTSTHAVVSQREQHCWVERERVEQPRRTGPSVGGAIVGGLLGGVLGHEVGNHHSQGAVTAGGAVLGAVVGAKVGESVNRRNDGGYDREVRRCETAASGPPEYWDVTYDYHGQEHRVQMTEPPGRTIRVNRDGEPRQ